ncbi:hypothetical protein RFI_34597 [Reticulomyxa filosa]|uniref:Uncharacterized protein n=1 Tax=Reticulomyxa filosa TaxID=46433 RepID=X6LN69_RETFI|nr:hypothetical protein RFI_34597 [Reticulomyxa filosa]|eukprot:ETO02816.1 hypothetical protein RFI_34597 [Reticulomyxa filosa]
MILLENFGNKIDKTTILKTWKNHNQLFVDTQEKLEEICATSNLNESKEGNELKIKREMCLHILWNILKYPKHIKYRQISKQALHNYLFEKYHSLGADLEQVLIIIEEELQCIGFKKGNDDNWYYQYDHIQLLHLWKCYQWWIHQQIMYVFILLLYKIRYYIPKKVYMLWNGKWKDSWILFDYEHRTIMLFDENKLKIKTLQLGNPNKSSLELNVHIQFYNYFDDVHDTCTKWACLILNHTWHLRTIDDRDYLSNFVSVNESKNVQMSLSIINYSYKETFKEPLNPYSMTFKHGIQHFKHKLQVRYHFMHGGDEPIYFKCKPELSSKMSNENVLLHDIYKHIPHYPIIQVHWEIEYVFMVPYKRTISIERSLPKSVPNQDIPISSNQKTKLNPFLYESDLCKLKHIQGITARVTRHKKLQKLLHEVIKNNCLIDLIPKNLLSKGEQRIKKQINFNEKDENGGLILNDEILTILDELKTLYHDDIHKHMGYPLQLWHICAILLYSGKSCNVQFSCDQIKLRHQKWPYLDMFLQEAIYILNKHERVEESEMELYCGLKEVRLENIKEIKQGFFINHVSTSDDIEVAKMYRSNQGCILHFHPSMRRPSNIFSCDVSWISPFKHEREILFARSFVSGYNKETTYKEQVAWSAKIESEDEYTQMILLTWSRYDQYIEQTMKISAMWDHTIDANIIYTILLEGGITLVNLYLSFFELWRMQPNNKKKYEEKKKEFMERRCCNCNINLFLMFTAEIAHQDYTSIELAAIYTIRNGLPFVKKENEKWKITKK